MIINREIQVIIIFSPNVDLLGLMILAVQLHWVRFIWMGFWENYFAFISGKPYSSPRSIMQLMNSKKGDDRKQMVTEPTKISR